MKKELLKIITFFFVSATTIFGQQISIHQFESEYYKKNTAIFNVSKSYLQKSSSSVKLNKTVFGYLPYWEYYSGTHKNIRYDLLTHLAVFSFEADSLGNLKDPLSWPWNEVITKTKENKVKLILAVTNFNGNAIHALLTNKTYKANFFANLNQRIRAYNFDGVNIDFESVKTSDRNSIISNFFAELRNYFQLQNLNMEISFASPIVNWGGWDFSMIAKNIDLFFIMGYDFYGDWSTTTGPSAPLIGGSYNISRSLSFDYYTVAQSNPEKLVLGVPYYGNYWQTKSANPYTAANGSSSKRYRQVIADYYSKEHLWDNTSNTPWLRWQDTTWNQIWYDDEKSLEMKYDLAIAKKIGGIGIWALGYDDGTSELWNLIERKFANSSSVESNKSLPTSTELEQNYPNPFNPSTLINYKISEVSFVSLKVYDMLGREVETLVNELKQPGKYSAQFTQHSFFASGVYFYTLRTRNHSAGSAKSFVQTKKMIFVK